jgi:hypothetical protein
MAIKPGWSGRCYEDFEVGDIYPHPLGRTITEADNIWFTLLSSQRPKCDRGVSPPKDYGLFRKPYFLLDCLRG